MVTLSSILRTLDLRHVGTCPTCMRISFLAMVLSWLLVLGALTLGLNATLLISIGSAGLTLLWLTHVITRAIRSINPPENHSRRLAIQTFAKAAAKAAV